MLTFQVTDQIIQDYLNELVPHYLIMNSFPVDDKTLKCEIDRLAASSWHDKFTSKNIETTMVRLQNAILNSDSKVQVPSDLVPEITLLVLYIAGSKFHAVNEQAGQAVIDDAISSYIKAHRLYKEQKLDKIFLELRTSSKSHVIFNNLGQLYPLHEKILHAIGETLMISPDSELYRLLHNTETTSKELKALELTYSIKLLRLEKSILANGALLLAKYLQEFADVPNKGSMISDDQIKIVYNIYNILGWTTSKTRPNNSNRNAYIKVFRNFIRDNQSFHYK